MPKFLNYKNPPVVEVAAGVQFESLPWLIAPRLGLVSQKFQSEFPHLEQQPPLPPEIEKLGVRQQPGLRLNFRFDTGKNTPRLWMLNSDGSELLQLQPDRFYRNWRKYKDPERTYPRYENHIRGSFLGSLQTFRNFLTDNGQPDIEVKQCELLYVNHIRAGGIWSKHSELGKAFRCWSENFGSEWGDKFESANFSLRKLLVDSNKKFIGRLHVTLEPGFVRPDDDQSAEEEIAFVLTMTARGRPIGETDGGIGEFFDLAHGEIVTTFDEITTPSMHRAWGKE